MALQERVEIRVKEGWLDLMGHKELKENRAK